MRFLPTVVMVSVLGACTTIDIREIDPSLQISHVCIQDNPKVIVPEFLQVVRKGFDRHGITTEVYSELKPNHCQYHLNYIALKNWDMANYMHHAELHLYRGVTAVAHAEYHLVGKGGLALNKWASVSSKMDPVIDKLLAGYSPAMVDTFRKDIPDSEANSAPEEEVKANQLRELKSWFDEGLISEEDYKLEKQKVLDR